MLAVLTQSIELHPFGGKGAKEQLHGK